MPLGMSMGLPILPMGRRRWPAAGTPVLTADFIADADADWLTLDCTFTAQVYLVRDVDPAGLINIIVWN